MFDGPVIGITKPTHGDNAAFAAIWLAVRMSGGVPLKLTAKRPHTDRWISGLVLGGGSDVYPELYKGQPVKDRRYDRDRDEMEQYWARKARDERLPVLGICRGAQLLNVINGGTLHPDIVELFPDAGYPSSFRGHVFYRKEIEIEPGSLLGGIVGADEIEVNSIHRQAINELGEGLAATAKEKNGVVQAIEDQQSDFYLGVQFHPEFLIYRKSDRRIFRALVKAAEARRAERRKAIGDARPPGEAKPYSG